MIPTQLHDSRRALAWRLLLVMGMKIPQGGLVDKNRNTLRQLLTLKQLLHLSAAVALVFVLSFTVPAKAQNTQPGTPM
ncbi:MAG: hypothetical protein WBQ00_00345, partial [Terriglobales bacterium]